MRLGESASPGWVWKALALAVCVIGLLYLLGFLLGGMLSPLKVLGQSQACQANVFRLAQGMRIYSEDYDDRFPPSAQWMDRVQFYLDSERRLHCPAVSAPGENRFGYAMNRAMRGKEKSKIERPEEVPLVYDSSDLARSAADNVTSLPVPGRHRTRARKGSPSQEGNYIGYVDGSGRIKLDAEAGPKRRP